MDKTARQDSWWALALSQALSLAMSFAGFLLVRLTSETQILPGYAHKCSQMLTAQGSLGHSILAFFAQCSLTDLGIEPQIWVRLQTKQKIRYPGH